MIAAALIMLLIFQPHQLFMPGFQLSFLVVGALVYGTRRVTRRWSGMETARNGSISSRLKEYISGAFAVSVVAWLISTPVVMHHFGIWSPYGILASVILTLPAAMILYCAYIRLLVGWASIPLDAFLRHLLDFICKMTIETVEYIDGLPLSSLKSEMPPTLLVILMIFVVVLWIHFGLRNTYWMCRQKLVRFRSSKRSDATIQYDSHTNQS